MNKNKQVLQVYVDKISVIPAKAKYICIKIKCGNDCERKCITQDIITPDAYTEDEHIIFNPKKLHFELEDHHVPPKVTLEVWMMPQCATDSYLLYCGLSHLKLSEYVESTGPNSFWVKVTGEDEREPQSTWAESTSLSRPKLHCPHLELHVKVEMFHPKCHTEKVVVQEVNMKNSNEFQFRFPSERIDWRQHLRPLHVGEIFHEKQFDKLHSLIPVTSHGKVESITSYGSKGKALVTLQLACQYANYCATKLQKHNITLKKKLNMYESEREKLNEKNKKLRLRKVKLQNQSALLSETIDKLSMLLEHSDPEFLHNYRLQCRNNRKEGKSQVN